MGRRLLLILTTVIVAAEVGCGDGANPAVPDAAPPPPDAALPPDATTRLELLSNGEFELAHGSNPAGWSSYESSFLHTYEREWTTEVALSPTHSVLITGPDSPVEEQFAYWVQVIPAGRNARRTRSFELSVAIKLEMVVGQGISIVLCGDDANGQPVSCAYTKGEIEIVGTADWSTYAVTLPPLPPTAQILHVALVMLPNTTGTAYFDDASLSY